MVSVYNSLTEQLSDESNSVPDGWEGLIEDKEGFVISNQSEIGSQNTKTRTDSFSIPYLAVGQGIYFDAVMRRLP